MEDATSLIFIRHGETMWNEQHRFHGQMDIPLSDTGKLQALALRERLKREHIDVAYSSDLSRAFETAQIILEERQICINPTAAIRERYLGAWEGLTFEEALNIYPKEVESWLKDPLASAPLGESGAQLVQRVEQFIKQLLSSHEGEHILVVSHAGPIKIAICLLLGWSEKSIRHFRISNGSISVVEINASGAICRLLNDESHLLKFRTQ